MIIVHHTEECTSKPINGRTTGPCNCKTAPLTEEARSDLRDFLSRAAQRSIAEGEDPDYFKIRLGLIADEIEKASRAIRPERTRARMASDR